LFIKTKVKKFNSNIDSAFIVTLYFILIKWEKFKWFCKEIYENRIVSKYLLKKVSTVAYHFALLDTQKILRYIISKEELQDNSRTRCRH
jgi:hypothetical protein